jgi:formylglycine-generating enzyme required for sulfatase activity
VGQKPANPWGLHDIHGGVWEWVQDWYAPDAYARGEATDPAGPTSGTKRVVRGGSWHSTGDGWRSSARATMNRSTAASASGCGSRWRPSSPRWPARFLETREENP